MTTALPILLLAAGQSRRMRGRDKLMEPIEGQTLLRRMAGRAVAAGLGPVYVALPPPPHPRYGTLSGLDLTPVEVPDAAEGMSASLRRALAVLPSAVPAAMILLADLPDLTSQDLRTVAQAVQLGSPHQIWRGAARGRPGHPVVIARPLFAQLMTLSGDTGAQPVLQANRSKMALVSLPGNHALNDLDTPEAWADWRAGRSPNAGSSPDPVTEGS